MQDIEELSSSETSSKKADQDYFNTIEEIERQNKNLQELHKLGNKVKNQYDNQVQEIQPRVANHQQVNSEFDKLRKRVFYLKYDKRKKSQGDPGNVPTEF